MVWLSDDEKNFEDVFICFDRVHERVDRQTDDGRTDKAWWNRPRLRIASRGKNYKQNTNRETHKNSTTPAACDAQR